MYAIENNLQNNPNGIRRETDGAWIPLDPANSDYQAYLAYVANGNKVPDTLVTESAPTAQ
jgi:hypothetical protein